MYLYNGNIYTLDLQHPKVRALAIRAGRVAAYGDESVIPAGLKIDAFDLGGRTVIPGLIDAHDHLASHGYGLATRWGLDEPASTAHLRTARVLAETLAMGYTTVRDAGGLDAGFKLAVEQGLIPGPRLVLAVQIISPTGGIGDRVSPSGHDCCGAADPLLPDSVANGPDAARDVSFSTRPRIFRVVVHNAATGVIRPALERSDPRQAWQAFGRLTHTAQDFYAHSNYVALWRERNPAAPPDQIDALLPARRRLDEDLGEAVERVRRDAGPGELILEACRGR